MRGDFRTLPSPFPRAWPGSGFRGEISIKSPWRGATEDLGDVRVDAALICSKQQIHQIRVGYGQSRVDTLYMRLARCFHANWAVFPAASVMCFPAFAP